MGRPKQYDLQSVLENSIHLFWERGFSKSSLADIEQATGIKKSSLYAAFKDKDDLHRKCLQHYIEKMNARNILSAEPLGKENIKKILLLTNKNIKNPKLPQGCFVINSIREIPNLSKATKDILNKNSEMLLELVSKNIKSVKPSISNLQCTSLAQLILTFSTGLGLRISGGLNDGIEKQVDEFLAYIL
jgi:TetR/AcrR family transcriptional regulator, copper-responsive repressor